jgi:Tol biopolymer transport system component
MGEVYRAYDTTLGRDVAVKILPEHFALDGERLRRFEREARTLAALNHPHIAQIYGVHQNGTPAIVMELVEGDTLAERIARGALPFVEALALARQMADALEAAHERGIVHRDLKPANIKVTPDGIVKVLDFGLAKVRETAEDAELAELPTITADVTHAGAVLGTAGYMSPEQARGQSVDRRADIWAFGCVLFEMLTARAAFAGATISDTIARVLEHEPDWSQLPASAAPTVRSILRRCLEKNLKHRFRDIGDVRIALEDATGREPDEPAEPRTAGRRRHLPWLIAATTLLAALVMAVLMWRAELGDVMSPGDVVRFTVAPPPGEMFVADVASPPSVAISPDGAQIAYVARGSDGDRLYLRRRSDVASAPMRGSEGAAGPFFSPDGRWIGFASGGMLRKMPVAGGAAQAIAPAPNFAGATWTTNDTIIYGPDWRTALFVVSANGREPRPITALDPQNNEVEHVSPQMLPTGTHLLMTVGTGNVATRAITGRHIAVVDLATGQRRTLIEGRNPVSLASGHLVFARDDALFAAPFDLSVLDLTGPPVRFLDAIQTSTSHTHFSLDHAGTLAYISLETGGDRRLLRVDRQGGRTPFAPQQAAFSHPRISPDARHVVVQVAGEFWLYDVERGSRTRLQARGSRPIWMPDGRSILFHSEGRLYTAPLNDSTEPALLLEPERGFAFPLAWSRDGQVLIYSNPVPGTDGSRDVWMLPHGGKPNGFLTSPRDERSAMFSPDGQWVVYAAKEGSREEEVYVQPYPGPGVRLVVSQGGGIEPVWSPTGREIFYRSVDGRRLMAVDVQTKPVFSVGTPRVLFEGPYPLGTSFWSDYDVFPDGREFLMIAADDVGAEQLHVAINWIAEVRRRLETPQ